MNLKIIPLLFLPVLTISLFASERVALVIGNDAYQHARKLNAAVNDASAIADSLRKLNFKVIPVSNAGVEAMLEAVSTLKKEAKGASSVVVYYAGHGIESGGVNYLVPVDAKLEREIQLKTQTVSLDGILEELKEIKVPARMIILDCCRDNPLEGRSWLETRSAGGGGLAALAQETLGEATLVVYSASPGKPALDRVDSTDVHSPFTSALLDQLPKPGVHSFEMFGLVEDGVIKRTGGRQAPRIFYNGSTQPFRSFHFATKETLVEAISRAPEPEPDSSLSGVLQALGTMSPDTEPTALEMPSPAVAVSSPQLPGRGYYDINELYTGGAYASYNTYSRGEILRHAQQKLKAAGHYTSTVDGAPGSGTQRALIAWQQANTVTVSGRLDEATIEGMGLVGISQMNPPAPTARPALKPSLPKPKQRSEGRSNAQDVLFGQ